MLHLLGLNFQQWENSPSSRIACSSAEQLCLIYFFSLVYGNWTPKQLWNISLYFCQGLLLIKIKQHLSFQSLCSLWTSQKKTCKKKRWEADRERERHPHREREREVILTLGESRCLTVGQNVKLLEQFSFPICHDASYPELTKTCIYQQTAEDNFQQHCAQSKERHSKDLIKPLEPEWSTDFIVSHRLCLLHSPKYLSNQHFSGKMMCHSEQAYLSGLAESICTIPFSETYETFPFDCPVWGLVLYVLGSSLPKRAKIEKIVLWILFAACHLRNERGFWCGSSIKAISDKVPILSVHQFPTSLIKNINIFL